MKSLFLTLCSSLFLFSQLFVCVVYSDEVPVLLWNIKGNTLHIKPVPALPPDDSIFLDSIKDALKNKANILVYSATSLSLEDLSPIRNSEESNTTLHSLQAFLNSHQNYMLLSSVKNPLDRIHKIHCGVQEIVVDKIIDDNVLQSIELAFERSCIVILHISNFGLLGVKGKNPENFQNVFLPPLEEKPKDIVGIFTAMKSSWGSLNQGYHLSRNLLASEEVDKKFFVNISSCLYFYAENATLTSDKNTIQLQLPPADTSGSECSESSAILSLDLKGDDGKTYNIKFNFSASNGAWKTETLGKINDSDMAFKTKDLEAPVGYSFSCGQYQLKNKSTSIEFQRFQVQPFKVKGQGFSESFDCVTWFTVPIWMGLIVTLLFVAIINCGVFSLFSISTMDRFDDPKGKTITVAVAE